MPSVREGKFIRRMQNRTSHLNAVCVSAFITQAGDEDDLLR